MSVQMVQARTGVGFEAGFGSGLYLPLCGFPQTRQRHLIPLVQLWVSRASCAAAGKDGGRDRRAPGSVCLPVFLFVTTAGFYFLQKLGDRTPLICLLFPVKGPASCLELPQGPRVCV